VKARSRAALILAVAVAVGGAAGCGGGGDSGTTGGDATGDGGGASLKVSSASLSKKEYVSKGDAICAKVPTEYRKLLNKLPKKQQGNRAIAATKAAIPPLRDATEEFAELGSPDGDKAKAQAIVDALEAAADGLEKEPNGELAGPKSSFAEFNKLTKAMGFQICAEL
jgi:hypothetical protein